MFKKLILNNFRLFEDKTIVLGRYLTVLAGRNSTGKSTILGILANSGEIKKSKGLTYSGKQFRAEFGEIFHGSKKFDVSLSKRMKVILSDDEGNEVDYRDFRTAWQNQNGKERFRVIPSKISEEGKKTEAKLEVPVLYLGLSRLYPIGESDEDNIKTSKMKFDTDKNKHWFVEKYNEILSLYDDIEQISNLSIGETSKKNGVGIKTHKYDHLTNSAGQDNLGQILLSVLSFDRLKKEWVGDWHGGLLLIDEVDATLHPAAQKRLLDLLYKEAKRLNIQVVVTTHSSDLLKHICSKTEYNNNDINNNIELYYFSTGNRHLEIKRNLNYSSIENDLMVQSMIQGTNKIKVYTEDEEARWFLDKLIPELLLYIEILDVKIGCDQLISLYMADISYFGNCLIVLDGDVTDKDLSSIPKTLRNKLNNIIKLPGCVRPEEVIYNYIINLPDEHPYWEKIDKFGFNWTYFKENGPDSTNYSQEKERERYKKWFKEHEEFFNTTSLFEYWMKDNDHEVKSFKTRFKKAYNSIASRTFAIKIDD